MNKAVVVIIDDWEGLYINGKLAEEGHTLNEGEERLGYFFDLSNTHNFNIEDLDFLDNNNKNFIEEVHISGSFPDDFNEIVF